MKPVYLAGQGIACSAGLDRPSIANALQQEHPRFERRILPTGDRPYAAIPDIGGNWSERLHRTLAHTLQTAIAEAGLTLAQAAGLPLFVGSSSLHVGLAESEGRSGQIPRIAHLGRYLRDGFGWQAPIAFYTTACTSSLVALAHAANTVAAGKTPAAIALAIELENRTSLNGFTAMGLLSPDQARPFCATRDGLVLGEAVAAAVVGPQPGRWRVAAIELGLDPYSPTGVDPSGRPQVEVMRRLLARAGWTPQSVDLIKAHAAGSPSNDLAEALALKALFKSMPTVLSLKSALGHTLGASGLTELAALTAGLEAGFIPRTAGFRRADDEIGIAPTTHAVRDALPRRTLLNWIGFGGSLAALALEDCRAC